MEYLKNIILSKLFLIDAIKTGNFTLKSGELSNLYFDMRVIMSYPNLYQLLFDYAILKYPELFKDINLVSGVEFGGIPFANYISQKTNLPQVHIRSAVKSYGTQNLIEGYYSKDENNLDNLLLVEDVITTGNSVYEKIKQVGNKLNITKILVLMDRRKDIVELITLFGYPLYSLFSLNDINEFIEKRLKKKEIEYFYNPNSNYVYNQAIEKKSNIILACDLEKCDDIIKLINLVGNNILGIKLHINIIQDFTHNFIEQLKSLKKLYNLIIIEDGKFADIGSIVIKQLDGFYKINEWADFITVHSITGKGIIESINQEYPNLGVILISELSSKNNLITQTQDYTKKTIEMTKDNEIKNKVAGFISQEETFKYINKFETLTFSPGINLSNSSDNLDQTYRNPLKLFNSNKTTPRIGMFWIVGRGIYKNNNNNNNNNDEDIFKSSLEYKKAGWDYFTTF
jgi:uridine monophosphate synthetase